MTATTVGYGDKLPRSPLGRLIGLLWMFSSLLIVGTFAGSLLHPTRARALSLTGRPGPPVQES